MDFNNVAELCPAQEETNDWGGNVGRRVTPERGWSSKEQGKTVECEGTGMIFSKKGIYIKELTVFPVTVIMWKSLCPKKNKIIKYIKIMIKCNH